MADNWCIYSFEQIKTAFKANSDFDRSDLEFPTELDISLMQSHHYRMRALIREVFKTATQPNLYAIGMAFFVYRSNPDVFWSCKNWDDFNRVSIHITKYRPKVRENTYCICSHNIYNIYTISYNGYYGMNGCDCIEKSNILSAKEDLERLTHYKCLLCKKSYKCTEDEQVFCGRCKKKPICKDKYITQACNMYTPRRPDMLLARQIVSKPTVIPTVVDSSLRSQSVPDTTPKVETKHLDIRSFFGPKKRITPTPPIGINLVFGKGTVIITPS